MGEATAGLRRWCGLYVTALLFVLIIVVVGSRQPLVLAGVPIAIVLAVVASKRLDLVSAILAVVAVLLMRPQAVGEQFSRVGDAVAVGAGLLAALADLDPARRTDTDDPSRVPMRRLQQTTIVLWVWLGIQVALGHSDLVTYLRGLADVPLTVVMLAIVLRSSARRRFVVKILVGVMTVACASYLVTALRIFATGDGAAGFWRYLPIGYTSSFDFPPGYINFAGTQTVQLDQPFTLMTVSAQHVGGINLPRFLVFAREPGMGAVFLVWALFMMRRVGWEQRWMRALLLVGLLGTLSSAGFGVLIAVWVVDRFLIRRYPDGSSLGALKQMVGLGVLAGAIWLAYFAPFVGLSNKSVVNTASIDDRSLNTVAGIGAMFTRPFGSSVDPSVRNVAINVLASGSTIGLVGVLLCMTVFWLTWRSSPDHRAAFAPVAAVFLTVLASQPFTDSAGLYVLIGLACCHFSAGGDGDRLAERLREVEDRGKGGGPHAGRAGDRAEVGSLGAA